MIIVFFIIGVAGSVHFLDKIGKAEQKDRLDCLKTCEPYAPIGHNYNKCMCNTKIILK